MVVKINALETVICAIEAKEDFVLQGGAGSGKTETLSLIIADLIYRNPSCRIACITHTNKAADEIKSRALGDHSISTIHSFINSIIKNYKKNIHKVISLLFEVNQITRLSLENYSDEKQQRLMEHDKYKKTYEKYAARHWIVYRNNKPKKPEGKKIYDDDPEHFNIILNNNIKKLNDEIKSIISQKGFQSIGYNETRFDNFKDLTYGHDGLLKIARWLFERYPLLGKIVNDKFGCIFIDEYQDTHPGILDIFLKLPKKNKPVLGLFGDSMQSIYTDGIGNVDDLVATGRLKKIEKIDNFRCSDEVTKFINTLRNDDLIQEVAFKTLKGVTETIDQRKGEVELFYKIYEKKPNARSSEQEKNQYIKELDSAINSSSFNSEFKTLLLSNRAVALKAGFPKLYDIFSDRYLEPKEEIVKILTRLQLLDLFEICNAYLEKNYNFVLSKLRKRGLSIRKSSDKSSIAKSIEEILSSKDSALNTVKSAFSKNLLLQSDSFSSYISRINVFLKDINNDSSYIKFEKDYLCENNTFTKMKRIIPDLEEDFFDEQERNLKQKMFYEKILSNEFTFSEVINFFRYEDEKTPYITMHKTKGTGIDNVLVVLDEYFWSEYNFQTIFSKDSGEVKKREKNLKLAYVACSRAKVNLRCVRLTTAEEKDSLLECFKDFRITAL